MVLGQCAQEAHTISVTGLSPSMADRSRSFTYHVCWSLPDRGVSRSSAPPQPRLANAYTLSRLVSLGCSRFARRYLGNRRLLSLPPGTEIFHFPGLASMRYGLKHGCDSITYHGFPHSGISGLTPVSGFPELIAAYYALRRLRAPRHPPYALPRLTIILPANVLFSSAVVKEHDVRPRVGTRLAGSVHPPLFAAVYASPHGHRGAAATLTGWLRDLRTQEPCHGVRQDETGKRERRESQPTSEQYVYDNRSRAGLRDAACLI
jgi:hypothetical protein